jgi:hypothetical protein
MTLEEALVQILSAQTSVTDQIKSGDRFRFFPLIIPQKAKAVDQVPCVVYQVNLEEFQKTYCGTESLTSASVQLDHYALKLADARRLSDACRVALVDFRGTVGSIVIRDVTIVNGLTLYDHDPGLMRVMDTYTIWFEKE